MEEAILFPTGVTPPPLADQPVVLCQTSVITVKGLNLFHLACLPSFSFHYNNLVMNNPREFCDSIVIILSTYYYKIQ